ncbi:MAG TPA: superinfection immunity protein [Paraburkholderia sp.]|jgi:type VI protein secretion system component VasK|nr:superinfection immunity protein [Paraburkholderia sp.]
MTQYFEALVVVAALIVYLVPSLEADAREHDDALAITLLNVLLGWTVIGWIAAWRAARSPASAARLSHVARRAQLAVAHATVERIVRHSRHCAPFAQQAGNPHRATRAVCTRL